jgi:hypothetical protein
MTELNLRLVLAGAQSRVIRALNGPTKSTTLEPGKVTRLSPALGGREVRS